MRWAWLSALFALPARSVRCASAARTSSASVVSAEEQQRHAHLVQAWWELSRAEAEVLDEAAYLSVFTRVYKAMVSAYTESQARESVAGDWEQDSDGTGTLGTAAAGPRTPVHAALCE